MDFFLIMIAPPLVLFFSVALLFIWGAYGKEKVGKEGEESTIELEK
ncbi:cytochrome bd oxidase small subunit CydS [Bacillus horti]|uniref:Membrane protein n=1 Tax=Caldalkalibacillus horti TaxID=77523 RepID=A0ABT9W3R0_9BACI|nr:hypothetical protein [Bacillus horti]MDQ0167890.1 putative membrane protein [Bacillus horti]